MGVTGTYVCHDYDDVGGRNEWHTVTITQLAPKSCIWRNTAGVAWALSATSDPLVWATGPDCCYYEDGHKAAKFTAKNGAVISVAGPGHESFVREHSIDLAETYNGQSFELAGSYECHAYDEGGKNDWHYVTIEQSGVAPGSASHSPCAHCAIPGSNNLYGATRNIHLEEQSRRVVDS